MQKFSETTSREIDRYGALIAMPSSVVRAVNCIAIRVIGIFMAFVCELLKYVRSSHRYLGRSQSTHPSLAASDQRQTWMWRMRQDDYHWPDETPRKAKYADRLRLC